MPAWLTPELVSLVVGGVSLLVAKLRGDKKVSKEKRRERLERWSRSSFWATEGLKLAGKIGKAEQDRNWSERIDGWAKMEKVKLTAECWAYMRVIRDDEASVEKSSAARALRDFMKESRSR